MMMLSRWEPLLAWMPPLVWMGVIFAMSSRSSVPAMPGMSTTILAAAGHLVVYAVLAVLLLRALGSDYQSQLRRAWLAWLIATIYGVTDEIHQYFVPGRYATVEDVILDAAGGAAGLLLYLVVVRRRQNVGALV